MENKIKTIDYSKNENYIIKSIDAENVYDVIFFIGTAVMKQTLPNGVNENLNEEKKSGELNYRAVGAQLTKVVSSKNNAYNANIIVPCYRQLALMYELENAKNHALIVEDMINKEPGKDLRTFLDYYFSKINPEGKRPFVIAGHSQGGAATQVVLKSYFLLEENKHYLKNLVALYSVGYGVSRKKFAELDTKLNGVEMIHLGKGAKDINCVLSWNAEGPNPEGPSFLLADDEYDTYVINPINWKTDETYASKEENLGVSIEDPNVPHEGIDTPHIFSFDLKDKFDAKINLKRGCVVCSEPHAGRYMTFPGFGKIWGGKSLHTCDGGAFYFNMAQNLGDRLDTYFGK